MKNHETWYFVCIVEVFSARGRSVIQLKIHSTVVCVPSLRPHVHLCCVAINKTKNIFIFIQQNATWFAAVRQRPQHSIWVGNWALGFLNDRNYCERIYGYYLLLFGECVLIQIRIKIKINSCIHSTHRITQFFSEMHVPKRQYDAFMPNSISSFAQTHCIACAAHIDWVPCRHPEKKLLVINLNTKIYILIHDPSCRTIRFFFSLFFT